MRKGKRGYINPTSLLGRKHEVEGVEKSLGTFCDKFLGDNLVGHNMGGIEEEEKRVCHRMRSNLLET